MTQTDPHIHQEYPNAKDETDHHLERIPSLQSEIALLKQHLSSLQTEEREAHEQLQSLTYAADLTRGEAQRRARGNTELSSVDDDATPSSPGSQQREVQRLEGELLNAKRDAANVVFDVEQLAFRLKRMREQTAGLAGPASPGLSSPCVGGIGSGRGSVKMSPVTRPGRLIGDVDCVAGLEEEWVGCRLGVGAGGNVGLYSYGGAGVVCGLDVGSARLEMLGDVQVGEWLESVDLWIGGERFELCGLGESVQAAVMLVRDAGEIVKADDEEVVDEVACED